MESIIDGIYRWNLKRNDINELIDVSRLTHTGPYRWNLKRNDINELTKPQQTQRLKERTSGCQGDGWRKGIFRESGMDMSTLLYLRRITNKDRL